MIRCHSRPEVFGRIDSIDEKDKEPTLKEIPLMSLKEYCYVDMGIPESKDLILTIGRSQPLATASPTPAVYKALICRGFVVSDSYV